MTSQVDELAIFSLTIVLSATAIWLWITWKARYLIAAIRNRDDRIFSMLTLGVLDLIILYMLVRAIDDTVGLDKNFVLFVSSLTQALLFMLGISIVSSWGWRMRRTQARGY